MLFFASKTEPDATSSDQFLKKINTLLRYCRNDAPKPDDKTHRRIIPQSIHKQDLSEGFGNYVVLSLLKYNKYLNMLRELRSDVSTEHLTFKDLDEKCWAAICEVYLHKSAYGSKIKTTELATTLLSNIRKPVRDYEFLIAIENLNLDPSQRILLPGIELRRVSQKEIDSWSISTFKENIIPELTDKPVAFLQEKGTKSSLACERARDRCAGAIKVLQTYLTECVDVQDDDVQIMLSEFTLYHVKNDGAVSKYYSCWHRRLNTRKLNYRPELSGFISNAFNDMNNIQSMSAQVREAILRCIHFIGEAIQQVNYDQKIISLCSALETLLVQETDGRKGEKISYRAILLSFCLKTTSILPDRFLCIYNLRSTIIHGKMVGVATDKDYSTLLYATRETLRNFISFVTAYGGKKVSDIVNTMENSPQATLLYNKLIDWYGVDHAITEELGSMLKINMNNKSLPEPQDAAGNKNTINAGASE